MLEHRQGRPGSGVEPTLTPCSGLLSSGSVGAALSVGRSSVRVMDKSLSWKKAGISWAAPGHVLYVSHNVEERGARLLARNLDNWLADHPELAPSSVEVTPMVINEQGTTFGRVLLKSETLLHFDPQTLRDAMDNALREAVRVADEQVELERQLADDFLRVLRGT